MNTASAAIQRTPKSTRVTGSDLLGRRHPRRPARRPPPPSLQMHMLPPSARCAKTANQSPLSACGVSCRAGAKGACAPTCGFAPNCLVPPLQGSPRASDSAYRLLKRSSVEETRGDGAPRPDMALPGPSTICRGWRATAASEHGVLQAPGDDSPRRSTLQSPSQSGFKGSRSAWYFSEKTTNCCC